MTQPLQAVPEPSNGKSDTSKCTLCEYRAGPFTSAKAAAEDHLRHLEQRHSKNMAGCECGWRSGPHTEPLSGLAALVAHAGDDHGIAWRPATLPKENEGLYRRTLIQCFEQAAKIEHGQGPKRIQVAGEPPYDPAAHLIDISHELLMGVACAIDLMLEARTGRPQIAKRPTKDADAAP